MNRNQIRAKALKNMGKAEVEGLADWKRARLETRARRKGRGTAPNCGNTHESGNQNKAKARRRKLKHPEANRGAEK